MANRRRSSLTSSNWRNVSSKRSTPLTRGAALYAILAVAVTAGVHLTFGQRTVPSVGIGTACYVILVNTL